MLKTHIIPIDNNFPEMADYSDRSVEVHFSRSQDWVEKVTGWESLPKQSFMSKLTPVCRHLDQLKNVDPNWLLDDLVITHVYYFSHKTQYHGTAQVSSVSRLNRADDNTLTVVVYNLDRDIIASLDIDLEKKTVKFKHLDTDIYNFQIAGFTVWKEKVPFDIPDSFTQGNNHFSVGPELFFSNYIKENKVAVISIPWVELCARDDEKLILSYTPYDQWKDIIPKIKYRKAEINIDDSTNICHFEYCDDVLVTSTVVHIPTVYVHYE